MELIDSHVHLLHPERFTYAWCAGSPVLDRAHRLADYQTAAAGAGSSTVTAVVFMEGDVPPAQQAAEAQEFSALAGAPGNSPAIAAVIAGAWPEAEDFSRQIGRLAGDGRIRGVRRVLHTQPDDLALTPRFAAHLRGLARHGLTFDLCLRPHLLPAAAELVARCPETRFVLDHCGVPDIAGGGLAAWREPFRRLAERPNVACKFSGLSSLCAAGRPLTPQVKPYFDHVLECFGPGRTMWGSDWPLCELTTGLAAWLETTATLLGGLSAADRAAIASGTARRTYRF